MPLVGHESPALANPAGESFTFEAGAHKLGGEQGWADVWKSGWSGASQVRCFDGKLFDDDHALPLDSDGLDILARARVLDWAHIEPSVLGTLKKRTLTNLYNQRPTWLDLAVFDAYGWPHNLSDDEILERLLALNLQRAAQP